MPLNLTLEYERLTRENEQLKARITELETAAKEANDRLLMFRITSRTSNVLIWDMKDEAAYQELSALLKG
jgi:cell division septum initiation protein DivIVA